MSVQPQLAAVFKIKIFQLYPLTSSPSSEELLIYQNIIIPNFPDLIGLFRDALRENKLQFLFFFLMNWPQICNENIFCKAKRTDLDIFNQFLITEASDSKPLVPDLVPAWTWFLPPPPGSCLQVPTWPKPDSARKVSRSFLIPNTGILMVSDRATLAAHHLEYIW